MPDKAERLIPPPRHRPTCHKEVQTEASFVPSLIDLSHHYDPLASEQYKNLVQLRKMIQRCMQEIMGTVYDTVHFKDIIYKLEENFPTDVPVTDMLLITSKLFRQNCELGRLLSCFFAAVFSDNNVDEHFHFMEIRILQKELKTLKQKLEQSEEEQARLQKMLTSVSQIAIDHGKAVEMLENHNQALQLQTSALEDQMALLFHQLNTDLKTNCKEAYDKVTNEMEIQERLKPTRNTFRQTMDSLSQQIRSSRTLITEVREALINCNQGPKTGEAYLAIEPSIRFKLKMLDSHFQQLLGRFNSVKDTVAETAYELMNALHERKKILYLSFQHIRLYDIQADKLRHSKTTLTELRSYTTDLLKKMQATFPSGAVTSIDRIGRITTQRWKGGYTINALRRNKQFAGSNANAGSGSGTAKKRSSSVAMPSQATEGETGSGDREKRISIARKSVEETFPLVNSGNDGSSDRNSNGSNGGQEDPNGNSMVLDAPAVDDPPPEGGRGSLSNPPPKKKFLIPKGGILPPAEVFLDVPNDAVPFESIGILMDLIKAIDTDLERLNSALTLEDEMSAFLRTLTLSVSSTVRLAGPENPMSDTLSLAHLEGVLENTLTPTGGQLLGSQRQQKGQAYSLLGKQDTEDETNPRSILGLSPSGGRESASPSDTKLTKAEKAVSNAVLIHQAQQLQKQQEQINKLNEDYSSKLGFLRQIYEARIADLEVKEASYRTKLAGMFDGNASTFNASTSSLRRRPPTEDLDLPLVRDVRSSAGRDEDLERLHRKTDKEEIMSLRSDWGKTKGGLMGLKSLREATVKEIEKLDEKLAAKRER